MELPYLYYFKVVAEKENMSRAAEQLHVSQPALSKAISKLERNLDVTLFERKKGRISLSPIGKIFYQQVCKAFDAIEEGELLIENYKQSSRGQIVIGCPVAELLNPLLGSYLDAVGEEEIQISQLICTPEALQESILSGKVDFAITPIPFHNPEITQIKLMDEEILVAVSLDHPFAGRRTVSIRELQSEKFLINEASFDQRAVTDTCRTAGFHPSISLSSNDSSFIDDALRHNRGITMVPSGIVYENRGGSRPWTALRLSDLDVSRFVSIVSRKDRTLMEHPRRLYNYALTFFDAYGRNLRAFLDACAPLPAEPRMPGLGLNRALLMDAPDPSPDRNPGLRARRNSQAAAEDAALPSSDPR